MTYKNQVRIVIGALCVSALAGCQPAVVEVPPDKTTVIHDHAPAAKPTTVVVTPPAATHTETHTNTVTPAPTPPDATGDSTPPPAPTTTTTTTGGG